MTHELFKKLPPDSMCYACDYEKAGFHRVRLAAFTHWSEIHKWCEQKFGDDYAWTGIVFWFTTHEDATEFALTWC